MLFNYLKLSVRLLLRDPFLTLINIAGLSIGFAAFCILWPYAQSELTADQFHPNHERIARLDRLYRYNESGFDKIVHINTHSCGIARNLLKEYVERL